MPETEIEVQRHGLIYLLSSASVTFIGFLATIFYAHWVGAEVLGVYFLFISYYTILDLFTNLGINYAATQRICSGVDQDEFFTATLTIRLLLYAAVCVIIILLRGYFADLNSSGLLFVLLAVLGVSTISSCINGAISARNRLGLTATVSILNNLTRITLQVIAVFLGYEVYGLIGGFVAGVLVELLIQLKFVDYHLKRFRWDHVQSLFMFSSWAVLLTAGTALFDNIPLIIIAYFLPVAEVGIFGVCWTFSFFALFISTALTNTLFVKVSRWNAEEDRNAIIQALSRATTYSLIFALPILAGGILLGYPLLYYLYGASFASGATALIIIIAMRAVQSVQNLYTYFLMATNHVKDAVVGTIIGMPLDIILCFLLIPVIGIPGAAAAALANTVIGFFAGRRYLGRVIPLNHDAKSLRDIAVATVIMTVALLLVSQVFASQSLFATMFMVVLGAAIYFAVLFRLNAPLREDALRTLKITWIPR
jgi:O-antigen/teichoic acid export membrane protein